jgi:transcriptional regulator with XRE-family HTH domain
MKFKHRIREEMKERNITYPELSTKTGINQRTLEEFVRRGDSGNFSILAKIAKSLDVTMDYLITQENPDEHYEPPPESFDDFNEMNEQTEREKPNKKAYNASFNERETFIEIISNANLYIEKDSKIATGMYIVAFKSMATEDFRYFKTSHIETLVRLCKQHNCKSEISVITEKFTNINFYCERKYLEFFAEILEEYDFPYRAKLFRDVLNKVM